MRWPQGAGATGGGVSAVFTKPTWQDGVNVPPSVNPPHQVGRGVVRENATEALPSVERSDFDRAQSALTHGVKAPKTHANMLDPLYFEEIIGHAERAVSYWNSLVLAAERGEALTVKVHARQLAAVTKEAIALVNALGKETADGGRA